MSTASILFGLVLFSVPVFAARRPAPWPRVIDGSQAIVANEEDLFQFELLPAGPYEVEMAGFAKVNVEAVEASVGKTTMVPVTLEPGKITDVLASRTRRPVPLLKPSGFQVKTR